MTKKIPMVARMIIIKDVICEKEQKKKEKDISYHNPNYDGSCEYCQNTTAWD